MNNYETLEQLYALFEEFLAGFKDILDQSDKDEYAKRDELLELGAKLGIL